jgi:hypothetical protein
VGSLALEAAGVGLGGGAEGVVACRLKTGRLVVVDLRREALLFGYHGRLIEPASPAVLGGDLLVGVDPKSVAVVPLR